MHNSKVGTEPLPFHLRKVCLCLWEGVSRQMAKCWDWICACQAVHVANSESLDQMCMQLNSYNSSPPCKFRFSCMTTPKSSSRHACKKGVCLLRWANLKCVGFLICSQESVTLLRARGDYNLMRILPNLSHFCSPILAVKFLVRFSDQILVPCDCS